MDIIKRFGLIVCLLMVLMAYLKQTIPRGKTMILMRSIISVFILISIVDGVRTLDFEGIKEIFDRPYQLVADDTLNEIELGLKNEFNAFLDEQGIDAVVNEVEMEENSIIKYVRIIGSEGNMAKQLLSARYQIHQQNIEVKNE